MGPKKEKECVKEIIRKDCSRMKLRGNFHQNGASKQGAQSNLIIEFDPPRRIILTSGFWKKNGIMKVKTK